jgi:hypothetical protein
MNRNERVIYLANVLQIAGADREISTQEAEAVERIKKDIGAGQEDLKEAIERVSGGGHKIKPVGRFSDQIRNLEDMVFVAASDSGISAEEKPDIVSFAKAVGVSQKQVNRILTEAGKRAEPGHHFKPCPSCEKDIPTASKFCPQCGTNLIGYGDE